jgi:pimeloyl-ACP methyl ester carboxylesterase
LLHGLGATAAVWHPLLPFVETHWRGRWIVPDLLGHGRSPHAATYSYGAHTAAVAEAVGQSPRIAIIGHSMGGIIGLMLATGWFGADISRVLALGVKLRWRAEDVARMANLAEAPVRWFDDRDAAVERYLRVSALAGLIDPESDVASAGILEEAGRFRLAADPRIHAVGAPPTDELMRIVKVPMRFAAGAADAMVSLEDMLACDPGAELIEDAGHNAHVERPDKVWELFESMSLRAASTA